MAKKYLLYIHNPKFDEESKKSELVNQLLERHYKPAPARSKEIIRLEAEIKQKQAILDSRDFSGPLFRDPKKKKL